MHLPAVNPSFFFIGKCDLKKNYEEKSYPHLSFYGKKNNFYLNRVDWYSFDLSEKGFNLITFRQGRNNQVIPT